uniref:SCP domain-containing protein n=1 Tax=Sphenodon punctatus TaxID=8508 RepID=A0A8D0GNV6_SPHPU
MRTRLLLAVPILLGLSLCCHSYDQSSALPDIEEVKFIEECVSMHNKFRSQVNPPASNMHYMSWDPDLAKTAKGWAKKCHFRHNPDLKIPGKAHPKFTSAGENIWTGSMPIFSVSKAITNWYEEVKDYNYVSNSCTGICGHYTQVVWATSYKVGCAVHFCPRVTDFSGPNAAHFICNYGPAGNYQTRPYKTGTACSECPGEKCGNKLCGNPDQDKPACDEYCITVLILRPSLIFLSFGATWFLQQHYPQIFIYQ